jgi:hypothetical protein
MHTFLKTCSVLLFGAAGIAAVIAWGSGNRELGIIGANIAVAALACFFVLHFRRDKVPDFLKRRYKGYLERSGFCFCISINSENGIAFLDVPFQSRHAGSSVARIALRQKVFAWSAASREPFLTVEINCGPGAYGVARFLVAIPLDYQGKKLNLEVGASVRYPEGRGEMLRFRNGIPVPYNVRFGIFSQMLKKLVFLLPGHHFHIHSELTLTLMLPSGVAQTLPAGIESHTDIHWTVGDGESLTSGGPVG